MQATIRWCSKMLILGEQDVRRCLSMKDCIDINRKALASLWENNGNANPTKAVVPTRLALPYHHRNKQDGDPQDWTLFKPAAFYSPENNVVMGIKVVSVRSQNASLGKPMVPATVMLVDAQSGQGQALLGGTYLTAARTAAGSAVATELCCTSRNVVNLVVFGAGLQAECHIDAMNCVLPSINSIIIVNRTRDRAAALKEVVQERYPNVETVDTVLLQEKELVQRAVSEAHVLVACSNSPTPLWDGSWLQPGCHVNGIGSYTFDMQEVDEQTVNRSRVLIDTWEALEVGDLKHLGASRENPLSTQLLGEVLQRTSDLPKRRASDGSVDCTFYKAVGTAIQDVMTAGMATERAKELGIGTDVDMS